MRVRNAAVLVPLVLLALLPGACQKSPPPAPEPPPPPPFQPGDGFEAQLAWSHLEALTAIGPRVSGTDGAEKARDYIEEQLEILGLEVQSQEIDVTLGGEDGEEIEVEYLAAVVPGASDDVFLFAAPFDTRPFEDFEFVGANDGGSGAAVLLELARVFNRSPLPYTAWFVFLDGEAARAAPGAETAEPAFFSSGTLARLLSDQDVLSRVRLAVVMNRVGDSELRIARDLRSERLYRQEFWRAAARLGHDEAFPPNQPFESPEASHLPLVAQGLRRVVALVDTSYGGEEPPGIYADTSSDTLAHCSPESLGAVGAVTVEASRQIATRLVRIDRFSDAPLDAAVVPIGPTLPDDVEEEAGPAGEDPATASPGEAAPAADVPAADSPSAEPSEPEPAPGA